MKIGFVMTECASCHHQVKVEPIPFGYGMVALCPLCRSLAYNKEEEEYETDKIAYNRSLKS